MRRRVLQPLAIALVLAACTAGPLPPGFDPDQVTITVVDAQQQPIAGAAVTGPGASARTDEQGRAKLPWAEHDTFGEFAVAAVGFVDTEEDWHACDQRIVLQRDEPIRVRVLDARTDHPLAGIRVGSQLSKLSATTDDDGVAVVRGFPPLAGSMPYLRLHRWRDECFRWGYWKYRSPRRRTEPVALDGDTYVVRLRPEPSKEFVLRAAPGRTFSNPTRVEADGEVVPNVVVEDRGRQLRCRLPLSMDAVVRVPGHEDFHAYADDDAAEPVAVDLRAGVRCSGTVLGPDGPIAGAVVTLSWDDQPRFWRVARSDGDGRWSAPDCPRNADMWMGVGGPRHLEVGMSVGALVDRAPLGTELVALGDVHLECEQLVVARLDPSWRGQSVQLWTTVTDGPAITGVAWSSLDGVVVMRGLAAGTHCLWWRVGDEERHRVFTLDGSRTVVDLGDLPGAAPPR